MTIAAGFVCMDGIVLCADTQESIPGYTKHSTDKIDRWEDENLTFAITGSGDSEIIQTVAQHIIEAGRREYTPNNYLYGDRAKTLIEEAFLKFFKKHLLPYPQNERPFVELLIAIQCHHNRYLLKASGTTVRNLDPGISPGADCIGSGVMLGHSLIEKLYNPFIDLDDLIIVACYIVFQAKKWVDGCGGNTDLLVLTDKLRTGMSSNEIEALEKLFGQYDQACGHLLTAIANPNISNANAGTAFKLNRNDLMEGRETLAKSAPTVLEFFKTVQAKKSKPRHT